MPIKFVHRKEKGIRPTRIVACVLAMVHAVVTASVNARIVAPVFIVKSTVVHRRTAKYVLVMAGVSATIWTCGLTHSRPNIDANVNHMIRIRPKRAKDLSKTVYQWSRHPRQIFTANIVNFIVPDTMRPSVQAAVIVKQALLYQNKISQELM
jgi:hypothetical protein